MGEYGLVLCEQSCHRLVLTCFVLALKWHDDEPPYYNTYYAKVGGISIRELNMMEEHLCKLLNWELYVSAEEYDRYRNLLLPSASDCAMTRADAVAFLHEST